jgi:hypothetical protein
MCIWCGVWGLFFCLDNGDYIIEHVAVDGTAFELGNALGFQRRREPSCRLPFSSYFYFL